jgi:hypothetical protein
MRKGETVNKAPAFSGNFSYVSDLRVACRIPFRRISLGEISSTLACYVDSGTGQHGYTATTATWAPYKLVHGATMIIVPPSRRIQDETKHTRQC